MPRHKPPAARRPRKGVGIQNRLPESLYAHHYWETLRGEHPGTLFVDTSAILAAFEPGEVAFNDFLQTTTDPLVTSSYVVAETVRRLVKQKNTEPFKGPAGERGWTLAEHFVLRWLQERGVSIVCVPDDIWKLSVGAFSNFASIACDLTDIMSFAIIQGLGQNRILARDGHFASLALMVLPGYSSRR